MSGEFGSDLLMTSCYDKDDVTLSFLRLDYQPVNTTWHISSPFNTAGPGTDSAGPRDVELLNWSGIFFVDCSNSDWQQSIISSVFLSSASRYMELIDTLAVNLCTRMNMHLCPGAARSL